MVLLALLLLMLLVPFPFHYIECFFVLVNVRENGELVKSRIIQHMMSLKKACAGTRVSALASASCSSRVCNDSAFVDTVALLQVFQRCCQRAVLRSA